jgi:hypothetical protein
VDGSHSLYTCPPAAAPVFEGAFCSFFWKALGTQRAQKHLDVALNTHILSPLLIKRNRSPKQFGLLALKRHPLAVQTAVRHILLAVDMDFYRTRRENTEGPVCPSPISNKYIVHQTADLKAKAGAF